MTKLEQKKQKLREIIKNGNSDNYYSPDSMHAKLASDLLAALEKMERIKFICESGSGAAEEALEIIHKRASECLNKIIERE